MMKKNGFTLIELLCVLVVLGLLMVIAVPSALTLNTRVLERAYDTKIDMIEQAASDYGLSNISLVRKGADFTNTSINYKCKFEFDSNTRKVKSVDFETSSFVEGETLGVDTYRCSRLKISDLTAFNALNNDYENQCSECNEQDRELYNNIVTNPVSKNIINNCYVYIYYRNSNVDAYFDKETCDLGRKDASIKDGLEYRPKMGEYKAE